ncbi:hypothetical protein M2140_000888 [Clostridiales Family XIII bacterium PM5-7]
MNKMNEFIKKLNTSRPEEWEQIPDIDLYMDQVIGYMTRQHIGLELDDEETLTSAMINNYIKSGLLPRAKGKKYNREHIGYLTAICLLKQVLSVGQAGVLLENQMEQRDIKDFYQHYKETLDVEFEKTAKLLEGHESDEELSQMALQLAISSYAQKLACQKILQSLTEEDDV